MEDLTGRRIGRFQVTRRLGGGGMGEVYAAHDPKLRRKVALKRLPPDLAADPTWRRRLLTEARSAAQIQHQCVAALHDIIEDGDELFLVMEYVQGHTLRQHPKPLSPDEFVRVAGRCAEALVAAHAHGIVHGDIKPENIMLTDDGHLKVLDFGVAGMIGEVSDDTSTVTHAPPRPGSLGWTPAYAAPEVLRGRPVDERADIFALGVVFYELIGGHHPFHAETSTAAAARILDEQPVPLPRLNPRVEPEVERIIGKMLAKDPDDRYASAADLLVDLRAQTKSHTDTRPWTGGSGRRRVPGWAKAAGVAALAITGLVALWAGFTGSGGRAGPDGSGLAVRPASFNAADWVIAVIPRPMLSSSDREIEMTKEGLASTLTTQLTRLSRAHGLQVIPVSTLREEGIDSFERARLDLGVTLVLDFDVRRLGDSLRVNVNLVDVRRKRQLTAETIDGALDDLLALEEMVALKVLRMLRLELRPMDQGVLEAGTQEPRAYNFYVLGRGYLQNYDDPRDVETAITLFEQSLRVDREFARAHAALGEALWYRYRHTREQSWVDRADQECALAVRADNLEAAGHVCRGTLYAGIGRYPEAAAAFERATELDSTSDDAFRGLADAYRRMGDLLLAEETFKEAIALRPGYWIGYNSLARFYFGSGRYAEAAHNFEEAVQLAPDNYRGYSNLGAAYFQTERWIDSRQAFERAVELNPGDGLSLSNLGTLDFYEGDYAAAGSRFRAALAVDDHDYLPWGNLGDAYYWGDDTRDRAAGAYGRALELVNEDLQVNPNDAWTLSEKAYLQAMLETGDARKHIEDALEYEPADVDVQYAAAQVYQVLGDTDRALELLAQAAGSGTPRRIIQADPIFQPLRDDPRFVALTAQRP